MPKRYKFNNQISNDLFLLARKVHQEVNAVKVANRPSEARKVAQSLQNLDELIKKMHHEINTIFKQR